MRSVKRRDSKEKKIFFSRTDDDECDEEAIPSRRNAVADGGPTRSYFLKLLFFLDVFASSLNSPTLNFILPMLLFSL